MSLTLANVRMKKERIEYLDLAKGICICIVMLFHIKGIVQYEMMMDPVLFSACMLPPFFFLSGLFFKEGQSFRVFLIDKTNRLLLPFGFFYLVTAVIMPNILYYGWGVNFQTVIGWESLWAFIWPGEYPNIPLWFLWSLFLINLIFWVLLNLSKGIFHHSVQVAMVVACFGFALIGKMAEETFNTDVACILKSLQNMPFFCIGFLSGKYNLQHKTGSLGTGHRIIMLFGAFLTTLLTFIPSLHNFIITDFLTFYLCGVAGTVLIIILSAFIHHLPLISYLGRYSIIIVLTHGLLVRVGTPLVIHISHSLAEGYTVFIVWILMSLSYLVIIPIIRFCLPHFTAQKPLLK